MQNPLHCSHHLYHPRILYNKNMNQSFSDRYAWLGQATHTVLAKNPSPCCSSLLPTPNTKVKKKKDVYIAPFEGGASRGSYVSQGVRPERVPAGAGESLSFCSFCPSSVPLPGYSTPSRDGCHKHSLYWLNISYLSIWRSLSHCLSLTNVWHYYIGRKVLPGLTEWIWCPDRS